MAKRNLALLLILAGIAVYFMPLIVGLTGTQNQIIGAVAAVGGVILLYLPGEESSKSKSKSKKKK